VVRPEEKPRDPNASPDDLALVQAIREKILAAQDATSTQSVGDYEGTIPATGVKYAMVAVEGGEFLMGSPAAESLRKDDEGPQTQVRVGGFWIGKYEVTWDQYEPFMINEIDRRKDGMRKDYDPAVHSLVDAVSQPTGPYMEMSFGMGRNGYPAISMTQHAANKFCQWLSVQTGHFYRLPTEAEWEYACRAGSTTAYSFGDDPEKLDQYAWYYDNSDERYHQVGQKKPNQWGIYDMHGNVMEWTADAYVTDYFARIAGNPQNPYVKPTALYPRSVRGGGWDDDPDRLRSAARRGSDPAWKQQDPQLPKSIWYHTDARWLGFRIVRPAEIPSAEEMYFYWNSAANMR
jgi:formylglycine-generating enzyme required for sulfatase activity